MSPDKKAKKTEEYLPKIIANWNELASRGDAGKPAKPAVGPSFVIDRKSLTDDLIRRELARVREEFITEAKKLEKVKLESLKSAIRTEYEQKIKTNADELGRAMRIINIQNAILSKIYERDKTALIEVLREAKISENDLKILAGTIEG
jgi:hypothetical protein